MKNKKEDIIKHSENITKLKKEKSKKYMNEAIL